MHWSVCGRVTLLALFSFIPSLPGRSACRWRAGYERIRWSGEKW
jgi:hypothetical protein